MTRTVLSVCIGNDPKEVGTLIFESTGNREYSTFQYAQKWLESSRRFAIDPGLPLDDTRRFFKAEVENASPFPGAVGDTLPDSWGRGIISKDSRLNKEGSGPLVEIDYLSAVDDYSRMGALRFRIEKTGSPFLASEPTGKHVVPPLLHLDQLGKEIASFESDDPDLAALRRLRQIGTPFGGARPKCSIVDSDGTLAIAKFTSKLDTMPVERAEVMTLCLATLCGINAAQARVEMSGALPVAIIRRFDRTPNGRRPYISAQTMLERPLATGATYAEMADAIRQYCVDPRGQLNELFRRIAFTILVSNVDDHLKNHGFLYANNRQWALSPVFDVNPAPERFRELKTAIADTTERQASIELLLQHADYFEVDADDAARTVKSMALTISGNWQKLAFQSGMKKSEVNAYHRAFDHPDAAYAMALGLPSNVQPISGLRKTSGTGRR